jgi:hypothetical protein
MAINRTFLLNDIASDLLEYGSYDVSSGSFLERALLDAMVDIDAAHQWPYRITQSTITTEIGTRTGYAVPSNFDSLALEEKTNKYWAYDSYGVPPPIADGTLGKRYPISFNQVSNTIEFYEDPGDGSKTFTYLTRCTGISDLDSWPDALWLKKLLRMRACFYAVNKNDDLKSQADNFWNLSEDAVKREKAYQRKGKTRPDTRTPLDINGNPIYYGFTGDL